MVKEPCNFYFIQLYPRPIALKYSQIYFLPFPCAERLSNIRLTCKSVPEGLGAQLALLFSQVACQRICQVEAVVIRFFLSFIPSFPAIFIP
jgi:hypothetical protein